MTALSKDADDAAPPAALAHAHSAILISLIIWRVCIATPDFSGADHLLWHVLLIFGCALLAWEWSRSWRQHLLWGPCGVVLVVLGLALLPAWMRGVQPSGAAGFALAMAGQIIFAGYCCQVIAGRAAIALAALLAAIALQASMAVGQWLWVLPELLRQLDTGALTAPAVQDGASELSERLRNGGSYGSFTLANGLGIALAAGLALATHWCWGLWRQGHAARWVSLLLPLWLGMGLLLADTKGAWAALAVATLIVALSHCRPRWRWAGIGVLGGGLLHLLLFWPLMDIPSIAVRVGYQMAAGSLWLESPWWGHGWEAFAQQGAQHLPVWGEYTRRVHNEILEALVAGGLLAAAPLLVLMVLAALPAKALRSQPEDTQDTEDSLQWPWLPLVPLILLPLIVVLGTLQSDNLAYWPGPSLAWALALGLLASGIVALGQRCRNLPWAGCWTAALVLLGGSLIDFHLHEISIISMLIVLCCCRARLRCIALSSPGQRQGAAAAAVAVILLASLLINMGQRRSAELSQAQRIASLLQEDLDQANAARLQQAVALPADLAVDRATLRQQAQQRLTHLAGRFPAHEPLLATAASSHQQPQERVQALQEHLQRFPPRIGTLTDLAVSHAQLRQWNEAIKRQQQAIALNPWLLPLRQQLIAYYRAAQQAPGSDTAAFAELIAKEEERLRELNSQVFSRNRLRTTSP